MAKRSSENKDRENEKVLKSISRYERSENTVGKKSYTQQEPENILLSFLKNFEFQ